MLNGTDEGDGRSKITNRNYVAYLDTSILGGTVSKYVLDKIDILTIYIDKLFKSIEDKSSKKTLNYALLDLTDAFTCEVLNTVSRQAVLNSCLHHFLVIFTYRDTKDDEYSTHTNLLKVYINIAKGLFQRYIIQKNVISKDGVKPSYSSFLKT